MSEPVNMYAELTCCSQSHPFDSRRVALTSEPQKIGRSVAKVKPTVDNLIFDCKVLSRNHAVIWYDSDGRVYLKDTKSSNGTFINNQRLSKGGEDSVPRELYSCDIVQFGVDIMENKKITHGCIVAMVRLFDSGGREMEVRGIQPQTSVTHFDVGPGSIDNREPSGAAIQELYQLQQFIKEAAHREQLLESKLAVLQNILESTIQASSTSWQALVDEDRLLSRIETLEAQLALYSKSTTEETLRDEVRRSHEEREKFEGAAKESLRAALQEKVEAVQKLADVERSLETTEEECARLKAECSFSQSELGSLAQKYAEVLNEIHELGNRLEEAEKNYSELESRAANDHVKLLAELTDSAGKENILNAKIESLQADNDFTKEQLAFMRVRVEQLNQAQLASPANHDFSTSDMDQSYPEQVKLSEQLGENQVQLETYRTKFEESQAELSISRKLITDLQEQLGLAKEEMVNSKNRAGVLDDRIRDSNAQINMMIESATEQLKVQLNEAMRQKEMSDHLCRRLEEEIVQKENILKTLRSGNGTISPSAIRRIAISSYGSQQRTPVHSSSPDIHSSSQPLFNEQDGLQGVPAVPDMPSINGKAQDAEDSSEATWPPDPCDVSTLQTHLAKAVQSKLMLEAELCKYKEELDLARNLQSRSQEDALVARRQLHDIQNQHSLAIEKVEHLEDQLRSEKNKRKQSVAEADQFKVQLQDTQQQMRHVSSESEELKNKLKLITEELEFERSLRSTSDLDNDNARIALHRQAAKNQAEFAGLKEECVSLKSRITAIEKEMRTSRKENCRLSSEYRRLQESYTDLEKLKEGLESKEKLFSFTPETVSTTKENVMERNETWTSDTEVLLLRKVTNDQCNEISNLRQRLTDEEYDFNYEDLRWQAQTVAAVSFVPLLILFVAFLLAFFPFFAAITGTADGNLGGQLNSGSDDSTSISPP